MIVVRLFGGLGNQLFQYALGRRLAIDRDVTLKLDLSWFHKQELREFKLDHFRIEAQTATLQDIACVTKANLKGPIRIFYLAIQKLLPYYFRRIVKEKLFIFDPNILRARNHVYLVGYWQSEKYFKRIEAILRNELSLKSIPCKKNKELLDTISENYSISVHVRRGDYVSNPNLKSLEALPERYYQEAIQKMNDLYPNPVFFVFSDDISWAKNSLRIPNHKIFVENNDSRFDYEDLRLMSSCKHHILANSSFSWWGAWLNPSQYKTIIAPRNWFKTKLINGHDLFLDNWILL